MEIFLLDSKMEIIAWLFLIVTTPGAGADRRIDRELGGVGRKESKNRKVEFWMETISKCAYNVW